MSKNVLITGGAGFIGSHLADVLIERGHSVRLLDLIHPQIHPDAPQPPAYLNPAAALLVGDMRDERLVNRALHDVDVVFHFAAYTGVGQSMYQMREYLDVNVTGTAVLLEQILRQTKRPQKLILSSSRAVYGEGAYLCDNCGRVSPAPRTADSLASGRWELSCPRCRRSVVPVPTPENHPVDPRSLYAVSKVGQEQLCQVFSETYDIPFVNLRYFNVYGPRQSLQNPYTGVISTFIMRQANGKPILVYEDGQESRDFVHVQDVVQACLLAMTQAAANGRTFNVGTGRPLTLLEIATAVAQILDGPPPQITGQYRVGDIRHCFADVTKSQEILGYHPQIKFEDGLRDLIASISDLHALTDLSEIAEEELRQRGLLDTGKGDLSL